MTDRGDIRIAILGAGNIGAALAGGLVRSRLAAAGDITLTRRRRHLLEPMAGKGFRTTTDNRAAVADSDIVILSVEPGQLDALLDQIAPALDPRRHLLVSLVTGVATERIARRIGDGVPVVRAMPNIAIAVGESMTCIAGGDPAAIERVATLFGNVGRVQILREEEMTAATALCACGVAFFLRAVRAASQGGIEIGIHAQEALTLAAQTAKGAAALLLASGAHPEGEIDKVTTPRGCTIAGLNRMEHEGFSSALIQGITVSAGKAAQLYTERNGHEGT